MDFCIDCGAKLENYLRQYWPSCYYERLKKREAEEKKEEEK